MQVMAMMTKGLTLTSQEVSGSCSYAGKGEPKKTNSFLSLSTTNCNL